MSLMVSKSSFPEKSRTPLHAQYPEYLQKNATLAYCKLHNWNFFSIKNSSSPKYVWITDLNLRSGRKLWRIEERQPSAATSKFPSISMTSLVWSTLVLTVTEALTSETEKERYWCPQRNMWVGNPLYKSPWRSAQCAALKLKFSSLASVELAFALSVAWFCRQTDFKQGS